mgnify:CR=1 FL=1
MAYLIFADRRGELARHELAGPVTVGRSQECSIAVHDAQLSRRHCKIERLLDSWVIEDLGSKNSTRVDGRVVTRHTLSNGDVIRIGRTLVCFRAGAFIPAPPADRPADLRPVNPIEALAGTVAGFRVETPPTVDTTNFPRPQPKPAEPNTPSLIEAQSLITGLSSSSWDELQTRGAAPPGRDTRARPVVSVNESHMQTIRSASSNRLRLSRLLALAGAAVTLVVVVVIIVARSL